MPQTIHRGIKAMIDEANAEIETISAADAIKLRRATTSSSSISATRARSSATAAFPARSPAPAACWSSGSIRQSPYAKPIFQEDKKFVFHCAGGLRSALAAKTAQDMGLKPVAHMGGGFAAWRDAGGPVEKWEPKKKG